MMRIESGFPSVGITIGVAMGGIAVLLIDTSSSRGELIKTIMVAIAVVFVLANLIALVMRARGIRRSTSKQNSESGNRWQDDEQK